MRRVASPKTRARIGMATNAMITRTMRLTMAMLKSCSSPSG